ncbi:Protein tyrosine phosphatase domain-containing protein 1 [Blyttiomyces sp. JEL0837]|nr:Protein tyrosine phosphatase domain-containing protein 1 [Blyttiomyces sp. JEL0837]
MSSLHCAFCGGVNCKYENYTLWTDDNACPNAIEGLYSNWITDSILAMQRPSTRKIRAYKLIETFIYNNITGIFNLQLPYEHQNCGDGLDERGSGFSYDPEDFMKFGISHFAFGWTDMDIPTFEHMLRLVQVMSFILEKGEKIAVHCHAGLGRTGLAIACYFVYAQHVDADKAIAMVRLKRYV